MDFGYELAKIFSCKNVSQNMTKLYLLAIPVIIGIITGMLMAFFPETENDSKLFE